MMALSFSQEEIKKAIELGQKPFTDRHFAKYFLEWNALDKFNIFKASSLLFLLTSGQAIRFLGIGGTRVYVDSQDKTKSPEEVKRQTAERVFIEVCGTLLATYVVLQLSLDLIGKGSTIASEGMAPMLHRMFNKLPRPEEKTGALNKAGAHLARALLKPRELSPRFLLMEAQKLVDEGKLSQAELEKFTHAIMKVTKSKNPFSFGFNSPEQALNEGWKLDKVEKALRDAGLEKLFKIDDEGRRTFSGLMEKPFSDYFARVNTMNVVTALGAAGISAYLSGGPIQHANDLVFRPWFHHFLDKRERERLAKLGQTPEVPHQSPFDHHTPNLYHDVSRVLQRHQKVKPLASSAGPLRPTQASLGYSGGLTL